MKNFIRYINGTFEEEKALYDIDSKRIKLIGDYYHNHIDDLIYGFLNGIMFCGENYTITDKLVYPNDNMFNMLNFEDCSEDE